MTLALAPPHCAAGRQAPPTVLLPSPRSTLRRCPHCHRPLDALARQRGALHCGQASCRHREAGRHRRQALDRQAATLLARLRVRRPGLAGVVWLSPAARALVTLSAAEREGMRAHLAQVIASEPATATATATVPDPDPDPITMTVTVPVPAPQRPPDAPAGSDHDHGLGRHLCAQCGGRCCQFGAAQHAFVDAAVLTRWVAAHAGSGLADAAAAYLARLPPQHGEDSCLYHTASGCALAADERADVCNRHACEALQTAEALGAADPGAALLALTAAQGTLQAAAVVDGRGRQPEVVRPSDDRDRTRDDDPTEKARPAPPGRGRRGHDARVPHVPTLTQLRDHAIARSLFRPTTLPKAIERLGFLQADPLRAPARAQDLTLRHRVAGYRAGDLDRRYPRLAVEEDFFVNYGYLPRATQALMHPRTARLVWDAAREAQAAAVLDFVRERGTVHPREVDARFSHGQVTNWFGGRSRASTELLDGMHYRGLLRVARREGGVRLYAPRLAPPSDVDPDTAMDRLVDVIVQTYAPLPARSLGELVSHLRGGAPQWAGRRVAALERARARLASAEVGGMRWFWPAGENPASRRHRPPEDLRLLAPFDPVVWDRRRFECFWGWAYRFEAYVPAHRRERGHYALPMLWRGEVIGWGNLSAAGGRLDGQFGYVAGRPPGDPVFRRALEEEMGRLAAFLGVA
ncbi:putative cytoplasmic protein [Piscinibacter sakaiensis]|uniref:Putative cytoplasmic protein n=1 Tax=Piscinibacter sakaiensis TaxID=1547922 RepID=A0A0K8P7G5_PISS1|nr:putative cytoplasmic protein [Piscinibacter sakaiensis]